MLVLETLVLAAADNGGMRGILFVLLLLAVALLIAGATIALRIFFAVRKDMLTLQMEDAPPLEVQNLQHVS